MPGIQQTTDLTSQYTTYRRSEDDFRPVTATTFTPGLAVKLASTDTQIYPTNDTVTLTGTGAGQQLIVGVVSDTWPGFNGSIGTPNYTSPTNATTIRGTQGVNVVTSGFHPGVLLDQSGTGAVTVTNGIPLVASRATAGYTQGVAAASAPGGMGTVGVAILPSSGIGSSLTAAALAQAAQTATVGGTPAAGDTLTVTIQAPYNTTSPGIAQTLSWTTTLTSAQAASTTTAAAALAAYLNTQSSFTTYFTASAALAVCTVTVNAAAAPFLVTFGSGSTLQGSFTISISGMVANSLTFATAATGGSTLTAGAANLASGTGYKGVVPTWVSPMHV